MKRQICYTYDLGGNMISRKEYALTEGNVGAVQKEDTFVYRSSGWKDQLLSYNGQVCTYDASGNPTVYRGKNLSWQRGRQLASAEADGQTVSFAYDSSGNRIRKSVGGSGTRYHYSGNSLMALEQGNTQVQFVYDTDGRPLMMRVNGSSDYFYLYNAQGDVTALIDSLNNPVVKYVYDSWGKMVSVTDTSGQGIGTLNPFRYRGYVYDAEIGWYYLGSRYYDAETGRFLNADAVSVLSSGMDSVYHKNLYIYYDNNPVIRTDFNGKIWHLAVGAIIGVVTQFIADAAIGIATGSSFSEVIDSLSPIDYISAAVGGAIAASGIGIVGAVTANATLSGATYLTNCSYRGVEANTNEFIFSTVIGGVSGLIGGSGANGRKMRGVYSRSKQVINVTKSARKAAMYSAKIVSIKKDVIKSSVRTFSAGGFSNVSNFFRKSFTRSEV